MSKLLIGEGYVKVRRTAAKVLCVVRFRTFVLLLTIVCSFSYEIMRRLRVWPFVTMKLAIKRSSSLIGLAPWQISRSIELNAR